MSGHDIVVIGGSAGGLEPLRELIKRLPGELSAAIFVVLHLAPDRPSLLPTLLNHGGQFLALHPADGTPIRNGCIYVAPPDQHMLIEGPIVRLVRGPRENRCRPAIDPLFRSAAACYGSRVVGVILSGNFDDGTAGMLAIRRRGGVALVQDPAQAVCRDMPESVMAAMPVDGCLPVADLAPRIEELVRRSADAAAPAPDETMQKELDAMSLDVERMASDERPGSSSPYSCPDCGGVLWEMEDEGLLRFRCRVGHAFSVDGVLAEQSETVERALWLALKTLEERASLLRRMTSRADAHAYQHISHRFSEELQKAQDGALALRKVLRRSPSAAGLRSEQ